MTTTLENRATSIEPRLSWDDPRGVAQAVLSVRLLISRVPKARIRVALWEGLQAVFGGDLGPTAQTASGPPDEEAFASDLSRWCRLMVETLTDLEGNHSDRLLAVVGIGEVICLQHHLQVENHHPGIELGTSAAELEEIAYWLRYSNRVAVTERLVRLAALIAAELDQIAAAAAIEDHRPISITPPRLHRPSAGPSAHGPPHPAPGVSTGSSMFRASATRPRFERVPPPRT